MHARAICTAPAHTGEDISIIDDLEPVSNLQLVPNGSMCSHKDYCVQASMQIGRMAAHPPDCSVNLTASRLQSKTYLNRQGCAHIEALHSSSRRHISSSLHASARGSVVTAYTPSAAGASEWDDILDSTSDKGTRAQRTGSKGPHGITKRAQNPSQSAGGGLGRADDWDLGSDRRASEQGRMRGRDSGWRGGGDSRGGRGRRASFSGRGNSNKPGASRSDRETWGGDSRGERGGSSSFPGRGSRDGNGASTSGREAWGKSSTAPSGDGWRPSSRGRASPGRGGPMPGHHRSIFSTEYMPGRFACQLIHQIKASPESSLS